MAERDGLLAAIAHEPDALENWIVNADWLCERSDPRGELINLELAIEAGATDEVLSNGGGRSCARCCSRRASRSGIIICGWPSVAASSTGHACILRELHLSNWGPLISNLRCASARHLSVRGASELHLSTSRT